MITAEAVDDDKGPNAIVHYALKQDLTGNWKTFSIHETTGLITLKKPLNRKKQKIYQVSRYLPILSEYFFIALPTSLTIKLAEANLNTFGKVDGTR